MGALDFAKRNRRPGLKRRKGRRDLLRNIMRPRSTFPMMKEQTRDLQTVKRFE